METRPNSQSVLTCQQIRKNFGKGQEIPHITSHCGEPTRHSVIDCSLEFSHRVTPEQTGTKRHEGVRVTGTFLDRGT